MRTHSSLFMLAALGVMSATSTAQAAGVVDTSEWKCESCPFPKGTAGSVEIGLRLVSDASAKFGDYSGLQRQGGTLVLGGEVHHNAEGGYHARLIVDELGISIRSVSAQSEREGLYALRLAYSEIPRHFADGAKTPFLGSGSATLSLPAGFPAASTTTMPLASTLQPLDLGLNFKRTELGGAWLGMGNWTYRVQLRHDVRSGNRATASSFFVSAAQFAAPVDEVTEQLEATASYVTRQLQVTLGYHASLFHNGQDALTWANPFFAVVNGATRGQLALAPDNQFHQLMASAGYELTPKIRASADVAVGRMTQDANFLASTLTPGLAATLQALPSRSLNGRVDTFNGSLRLSAEPIDHLRLNASYSRDVRDNRTAVQSFPAVATDIFVGTAPRSNETFSLWQDRLKLSADYRFSSSFKLSGGFEHDQRERSYQEVVKTRESTVWGRIQVQPLESFSVMFKAAHAERRHSTYGTSVWTDTLDNPLLRKYSLAARQRDTVGARADFTLNDKLSIGLAADYANDDYTESTVGLTAARSASVGAELSYAMSETTQAQFFAQAERIRSRQAGSEAYAAPDWNAQNKDRFEVVGLSIKHAAVADKLDIGAELSLARSHSDVALDTAAGSSAFPSATTQLDSFKLLATYKLSKEMLLTGSYGHEVYRSQDWQRDGVLPASVFNLLSLGQQAPHYRINVLRLALRYRF
jgi:MtrB/PioB family decaheme-associated outer membrane protein